MMETVILLQGGTPDELHASLASNEYCRGLLTSMGIGWSVAAVDGGLRDWSTLDVIVQRHPGAVVLNNCHGGNTGNGFLQAHLEKLGVRYTNSGMLASLTCLDKYATNSLLHERGIPASRALTTVTGILLEDSVFCTMPSAVIKPRYGGNSVGVALWGRDQKLPRMEGHVEYVVEQYLEGTEITVALMGDRVLGSAEIEIPSGEVFSVDLKFGDRPPPVHIPPRLSPYVLAEAHETALRASLALGCRGAHRVDMRVVDGVPTVIEINTQPALRASSLWMRIAAAGMEPTATLRWILDDASTRR